MNKFYNKNILILTLLGFISGFTFHFFSGFYALINLVAGITYISTFMHIVYKNDNVKSVAYKSFLFSLIANFITYSWLYKPFEFLGFSKIITMILGMFGIFFVGAVLSLFTVIPAIITFKTKKSNRQLIFATTFILMGMLKGTFFNWNPIGSIWSNFPIMMQLASLIGIHGVSFITVLLFSVPSLIFLKQITKQQKIFFQVFITGILLFGYNRLQTKNKNTDFIVRVVDVKISQNFVTDKDTLISLKKYKDTIFEPENYHIDMFVLPESSSPIDLTYKWYLDYFNNIIEPQKSPIITGFNRYVFKNTNAKDYFMYNTLGVIENGKITNTYDKIKLVPFGEYIPFKNFIPITKFTDGAVDFSSGKNRNILKIKNLSFYPLICFEAIFNRFLIPENVTAIINISNDAWFSELGKKQHYNLIKWRAVEQGVSIIRSANQGLKNKGASLINPYGIEVVGEIIKSEFDIKDFTLPARIKRPLFSYTGNLPVLLFLLIIFIKFLPYHNKHIKCFSKSKKK